MKSNLWVGIILILLGVLGLGFTLQELVRETVKLDVAQKCYNFDNTNEFCGEILKDE